MLRNVHFRPSGQYHVRHFRCDSLNQMAGYPTLDIAQALNGFDDIIDVRSPTEYADDHLPGAISMPVLDDAERARVGTIYTQVSPFIAKKVGAALIARNIAGHLEAALQDRPKHWRPLVYCWRGGMRSGAMAQILSQVGWKVTQLAGGYKAYRRHVIESLETLLEQCRYVMVYGPTGSGNSRLLQALSSAGAQVLDLEQLARHRGSLLGMLPDAEQPSQKTFESGIFDVLRMFDPARPVFVEAESRKVGVLSLPDALLRGIREAPCLQIEAAYEMRVELLMEDYAHFLRDPATLKARLALLTELYGHRVVDAWGTLADRGEWATLVSELLDKHYDPAYQRSSQSNFGRFATARVLRLDALDTASLSKAADDFLKEENLLK